jgi:FkbM family methyltransferase
MNSKFGVRLRRVLGIARRGIAMFESREVASPRQAFSGVWIDVGAFLGTETLWAARENPSIQVYAFEPNLKLASKTWGLLSNFTVLPLAVAEMDGFAQFYINANEGASSLLPFNPDGLQRWIGRELLRVETCIQVPTIRLDTFMELKGISHVDYLKVDAQGADLNVIRSAGERIKDIRKIMLEVAVTPVSLYQGAASRAETVSYLQSVGFELAEVQTQTHGQEENLTFKRVRRSW